MKRLKERLSQIKAKTKDKGAAIAKGSTLRQFMEYLGSLLEITTTLCLFKRSTVSPAIAPGSSSEVLMKLNLCAPSI
jgi:hypothetical protein